MADVKYYCLLLGRNKKKKKEKTSKRSAQGEKGPLKEKKKITSCKQHGPLQEPEGSSPEVKYCPPFMSAPIVDPGGPT